MLSLALAGAALISLLVFWRINTQKRKVPCRWQKSSGAAPNQLGKWVCKACGAEGFSTVKTGPRTCQRQVRQRPL